MGSQTNYLATLKNHLYTRRKDSVVSKLKGSIDGSPSPPQSAHGRMTRPVLVPNNTIPQISVNNSKAQIKTSSSPDSVTSTVKAYHPPYPDGTSTLVRRGKFRGVFDERHLRCILIQESHYDSIHCRYRLCYCMKALIVPSPLRQCMDASEMDELERNEPLWDEPNNWNIREIHLLSRMRHRLTETRSTGQDHHRITSFHNERFSSRTVLHNCA
jgi:hypothetical protein